MTFDDEYAALDSLGLTVLAYTDGTPEQLARLAAVAEMQAELITSVAAAAATVAASDFSTPAAFLATVTAAGNLAGGYAALAALA